MSIILEFLDLFLEIFSWFLFAYIIMGWFPAAYTTSLYRFLDGVFSRVLEPIRRVIPPIPVGGAAIDLSPMLLILLIHFLRRFLLWS